MSAQKLAASRNCLWQDSRWRARGRDRSTVVESPGFRRTLRVFTTGERRGPRAPSRCSPLRLAAPPAQTREPVASSIAALGWPHWGLTPSFVDAALHFRSALLHTLHSAVRKLRRQARTEGPGVVSTASSASATCASETVPTRSLAELTAAPKVCLPTVSSRRVAPPGSVPSLPRCLRRQPVGSPRTAEPRGPRDPSRAAADCALSAPATMLLRARLGLH